jgi:hypothetical protein
LDRINSNKKEVKIMYEVEWPMFQSELTQLFGRPSKVAGQNPWLKFIDLSYYVDALKTCRGLRTSRGVGFWGHELLQTELPRVFETLIARNLIIGLKTFDGCWNVRPMSGSSKSLSVHSWGLALDFNAAQNPYGGKITFSDEMIIAWADCGWESGAIWNTPDGMHFQLCWTKNWLERRQTPFTPKLDFEPGPPVDRDNEGVIIQDAGIIIPDVAGY